MNENFPTITLSRIVDRCDTPEDWTRLDHETERDPELWRRLAAMLRDDCVLRHAVGARLAATAAVELPAPVARPRRVSAEWVLGAACALVVFVSLVWPRGGPAPVTAGDPDVLLSRYVEAGRKAGLVVDELPSVPLEVRQTTDTDSVEVFYVRRFVERRTIREAWELGSDEHGRLQPARVDLAVHKPGTSF